MGWLQVHAPPRFSLRKAAAAVAAPPPLTRDAAAYETALHLCAVAA
jgi:hypothetical protein